MLLKISELECKDVKIYISNRCTSQIMGLKFLIIPFILLSLYSCKSEIINGYTGKISYSEEDSIEVFLNGKKSIEKFKLNISSLNGETLLTKTIHLFPQDTNLNKPYKNGFDYKKSTTLNNHGLTTGVYLIDEEIPLLIRASKKKKYDILILYSSNTENAYSSSGGKSMYAYNSSNQKASTITSFERPIELPVHSTEFLKWIATQNQYTIGYISDEDLDNYEYLEQTNLLIIPGHSEYWTKKARKNFDRFIDEGNNALILSGNTMWWQVRYNKLNNQMICYKSISDDPTNDTSLLTFRWSYPLLDYPIAESIGLSFNNGGYGKEQDKGWDGLKIKISNTKLFEGCDIKKNQILALETDEWDGANLQFDQDSSNVELVNDHNFFKYELLGYDLVSRGKKEKNGAWIIFQKTQKSGIVMNTGSTNWCGKEGMTGKDSETIKRITLNAIDILTSKYPSDIFK